MERILEYSTVNKFIASFAAKKPGSETLSAGSMKLLRHSRESCDRYTRAFTLHLTFVDQRSKTLIAFQI